VTAARRAVELERRGWTNVAIVDGGILGWIHAGFDVTP
jgi:hypothetical protein